MPAAQSQNRILPGPQRCVDGDDRMGPAALGLLHELAANVVIGFARDERHLGLRDARFLARDALQVGSEIVDMFERDLGDCADQRCEHVGRVEPAAQPHLDDGDIHVARREIGECDRGGSLEEAGVETLDVRLELRGPLGERVFPDRHAVDRDALHGGDEMGGGVEPHPPALGPQLLRDEGAGRALAVGTTDVNGREMALRMPQDVEQPLGWAEAPLDTTSLSREEVLDGVFEGQSAASAGQAPVM